ncbi:MAG TPA: lipid-binding SYLF domain-containing protein [Candidatus Eisenbacteria bacterium]|jgi:lipid-binding SYLF domain-containing protein|nr:lipid-binding SYLF domain-containing protein [Candidatus Eisenbacteria bacterium]
MMKFDFRRANFKGPTAIMRLGFAISAITLAISTSSVSLAASKATINRDAKATLDKLYKNNPGAKALGDKSVGVLVFPSIVKGGFIIAGQFGDGALRRNGKSVAYYRSLAASYGFQAGAQAFGYVLFFMDDDSLRYLDNSAGFELGTGPSLVVLDSGFGKNFSTTTLQKGIYAFIFDQKGLMGGVGIQGTKITKINPNP